MKKRRKSYLPAIIALLAAVLIAVVMLIVWKQWEYGASEAFYEGLRGALRIGGRCA